jgi:uncharacterized membrane protein HdeD (DUF308 family)
MVLAQPDRDDMRRHWRTLMVLGFLLVVAGELAVCSVTMGPATAAGGPLGLVLVGAGALHLYAPVRLAVWVGRHLQSLAGAVYLAAGAWLICSPPIRAAAVMPLLGACFIGGAAFQILVALTQRRFLRSWAVLSGGATAILGILMMSAWRDPGLETLGWFAGLELLVAGITCLGLAWFGWRSWRIDDSTDKGEPAMGFDQRGILVFTVSRGSGGMWEVYEQGFDEPLASFGLRREACDYAHGLAGLKPGSLVISDPPDDPPGLSYA